MNQVGAIQHVRYSRALTLLALVGIVLSVLSLYEYTALKNNVENSLGFCNISAAISCDKVNRSHWSSLLGIPVASWGIIYFFTLFILASSPATEGAGQARRASVLLLLGWTGVVVSIFLFSVSKFSIGAYCPICVLVYVVTIIFLVTAWISGNKWSTAERLKLGMESLLAIPSTVQQSQTARLTGLLIGLSALVAVGLEDSLLVRFIAPEFNRKEQQTLAQNTVNNWMKASSLGLTLSVKEGPNKDFTSGPETAPIQIVEFSDFQCPHCRKTFFELEPMLEQYRDKVHFVFKNFPLDMSCNPHMPQPMHELACRAAIFAQCAGEQGQFWQAARFLFAYPPFDEGKVSADRFETDLRAAIASLRLDATAMDECQNSSRPKDKIAQDSDKASQANIPGTPYFIVNDKPLDYPSTDALKQIFDSILNTYPAEHD